jgi:hypothetical protein
MHVCGVCGAEFDPSGYQLVVNGRSYHSVDCAVRALEYTVLEAEPVVPSQDEDAVPAEPSYGRVYSLAGVLALPGDERRSDHRLAAS